jgi:chromosome segregation ATPase
MGILIAAVLWAGPAGAAYKCVDAKGVTHIGDTPPPGCAAVMMYEVTPSGKVLRAIEPTPTPEQAKAIAAEQAKKREADAKAADQKRRDLALTNTYGSEKEFDVARDRNIEPIKARIATAHERIQQVEKRQKDVEEEMEFYKAGKTKASKGREVPLNLTEELARVQRERSALESTIASSEKEIEQVKAKFDSDKKRWVEIKGAAPKTADSAPPPDPKAVKKN